MRISLIPASSAGRPLDQHRVILKKIGGWVKNNASEMRVFKQKTEREIELGEGDNYIKFDFTNPHHAALTEIWQSHNVDIMEMLEKYVNICFEKFLASGEVCVWFGEVLIKRSTED